MSRKWYQENYFNRRNWLLENIGNRDLTAQEALVVLLIDYHNEFSKGITLQQLSHDSHLDLQQLDVVLNSLCNKGYLSIITKNKVSFIIDNIFEDKKVEKQVSENIFELFEEQFARPLSQREATILSEWVNLYPSDKIIMALREAVIKQRVTFNYIDKILASGDSNETV